MRPVDLAELERSARALLPAGTYDFIAGGAGDEVTVRENNQAWSDFRVRPRVLADVTTISTRTELFGAVLESPILVAPVAYQRLLHPQGELATAAGAARAGTAMVVPMRSSTPLEPLRTLPGSRWFQVYVLRDRSLTEELVLAASGHGYQALVLTVDSPYLGDRRRDQRNGFTVPTQILDPTPAHGWPEGTPEGDERTDQSPSVTPADIAWLGETSGLPVLVKGVMRADDAERCLEAGAGGFIVSNHGGRQLDRALATAHALEEVVAAVGAQVPVLVDGGIRSGTDVLIALALGASGVLVGRPVMWGLATGGADGVARVLTMLTEQLRSAMGLCGTRHLGQITSDLVVTR